ncbi:ABC transporter G family member 22-like protein, partial [Trifolium pratense]
MEDGNYTSGLWRTKSEQLESVIEDLKSPPGSSESNGVVDGGSGSLTRKSGKRTSPGGRNAHIRKARSAQTSLKVDLDEVNSGAALSRASSLGLSFSFTGFSVPLDEISNSKPFSDDDI